mgnify:CR=1 FL=1
MATGTWYRARTKEDQGVVLLFTSGDGVKWFCTHRLKSPKPFGFMWECPDLFEIDGQQIMTCCPQGVEQQGYEYQNVYQCGYFPVSFDMENKKYEFSEFTELDKGFDIYATQTIKGVSGDYANGNDYIRNITTYRFVRTEPGRVQFDAKRRGTIKIVYEKEQKGAR